MNKIKILVVALAMICSSITSVFAYMYFFETEPTYIASGITLQSYPTPNMTLGFYWDENCTLPVTTFDFGEMIHPNYQPTLITAPIYIRNEGDVWHDIRWNSTLSLVSGEFEEQWSLNSHIDHRWHYDPIYGCLLNSGSVLTTYYKIRIPAYATVGTYNWTLTAWGEYYY